MLVKSILLWYILSRPGMIYIIHGILCTSTIIIYPVKSDKYKSQNVCMHTRTIHTDLAIHCCDWHSDRSV